MSYSFTDRLAEQVITYRKEHDETAAKFAKGCGVSTATIRKLESGNGNLRADTADKILHHMGMTPMDLLPPLAADCPTAKKKELQRSKEITPLPQALLFSEILANIPASDESLAELFPDPYNPPKASVTRLGLEVLKLRLEGLDSAQTAEKLHISRGQVDHWSLMTVRMLKRRRPEHVEIDIPALRKLLGIEPYGFIGKYTKLSELLRDMPSDEVLLQLDRERGNIIGGRRRRVSHQDLYVLQQRLAGRTYRSIGEEFNQSPESTRRRIWKTKVGLKRYLAVELDVPGLFD